MNRRWLLETADVPIRYNLNNVIEGSRPLLQNREVSEWFSRLSERSLADNIGDVHGSHDYRMENILGKCWILGLNKNIQPFSEKISFIIEFLNQHIQTVPSNELNFSKLYHYRDNEKVLCCFLPLLGFHDEPAVLHITRKRIDILYNFIQQKRYDIYMDGSMLKGVKKEWQPYIINPELYSDGHIALLDMHDFLLFTEGYDCYHFTAFAYYCCVEAGFQIPYSPDECVSCSLAGCGGWEDFALGEDRIEYHPRNDTSFTPSGGDIVLYDRVFMNCEHDHIGIVLENKTSSIIAAEGNTYNDNISRILERNKDEHIRAYIRLPENFHYYTNK